MKVPQVDLSRTYQELEPEILAAVEELLRSQRMVLGPAVDRFEQSLAAWCGSLFAVGCGSGSDALVLALLAVGVKPGDEVVTRPPAGSSASRSWRESRSTCSTMG